jgi:hypothetical protein
MRIHIGIIAEDKSDVEVIDAIIAKISKVPYAIHRFVGSGCAKIRAKCGAWAQNLRDRGCKLLIVVHDSDNSDPNKLKNEIKAALGSSAVGSYLIVIPVREIEAWLLADHGAISRALKLSYPLNKISNPESVLRPKEKLRDLIYTKSRPQIKYVNAVHNKKIAMECTLQNLGRCESFLALKTFLGDNLVRR